MTKKSVAKIPTSKAKTAFGLLGEICALALEEPKRLRMSLLCVNEQSYARPGGLAREFGYMAPACGTVGCVAGWTLTLKDPTWVDGVRGSRLVRAADILGLNERQSDALFLTYPKAMDGTPAHARQEVRFIRAFQKKYRAQLLAKKV